MHLLQEMLAQVLLQSHHWNIKENHGMKFQDFCQKIPLLAAQLDKYCFSFTQVNLGTHKNNTCLFTHIRTLKINPASIYFEEIKIIWNIKKKKLYYS